MTPPMRDIIKIYLSTHRDRYGKDKASNFRLSKGWFNNNIRQIQNKEGKKITIHADCYINRKDSDVEIGHRIGFENDTYEVIDVDNGKGDLRIEFYILMLRKIDVDGNEY